MEFPGGPSKYADIGMGSGGIEQEMRRRHMMMGGEPEMGRAMGLN